MKKTILAKTLEGGLIEPHHEIEANQFVGRLA
jgi:hypothetical protein